MSSTDPSRRGRRALTIPKALLLAVVLVLALAVGVAGFILAASSATPRARSSSAFAGPVFPANLRAPSFSLTDHDGKRATLSQYRGHVVMLRLHVLPLQRRLPAHGHRDPRSARPATSHRQGARSSDQRRPGAPPPRAPARFSPARI